MGGLHNTMLWMFFCLHGGFLIQEEKHTRYAVGGAAELSQRHMGRPPGPPQGTVLGYSARGGSHLVRTPSDNLEGFTARWVVNPLL